MLPIAIGTPEIAIIVAVAVLLFGAKKLPELARSAGQSIKEFKKGFKEEQEDDNQTDSKQ
jgi:sec-independent protein translocase protein TatA